MTEQPRALEGLRVLDAATFIAGPYCASILGEFGAEVIKIEQPPNEKGGGGDPWRRYGTPSGRDDSSLAWLSEARNKTSLTLNLRTPEGQRIMKDLVAKSDVLIENFRPGTLEKWGLGWEALSTVNPGLVLTRITGYGQTGPYKDRPGFARVAHAVGGLTYLSGQPGEIPVTPGSTSLADYMTGLFGAVGALVALKHRDATGEGQVIDAALYESVFRVLDEIAPRHAKEGFVREPEGAGTINACPHGHFPCGDGRFVSLACTTDKMFERLCGAMERPDLLSAYGDQSARLENRDAVIRQVTDWTASKPREEVMAACVDAEVPAGPINSIADIFADPHFKAREALVTVTHPDPAVGDVVVPGPVPKLSRTPGRLERLGPGLGEGTDRVLTDVLGMSPADVAGLRAKGVV